MEKLLKNFNVLGSEQTQFKKFTDYDEGATFQVIRFSNCLTKFGPTVIVQVQKDDEIFNLNLPKRFVSLFDTEEKLSQWNSTNNLKIIYIGIKNKAIMLNIVK